MKAWKKETKERAYKEDRRKDDVSMCTSEQANDNCRAVSSPRASACLWLGAPSVFRTVTPPIVSLLQPTWVQGASHIHTHVRTCSSLCETSQTQPRSFVKVGPVTSPLEQERPNSAGIDCPDWDFTRFLYCPRECRYSSLTQDISQVLSSYLRSSPSPFSLLPVADFKYLRFRISIHFCHFCGCKCLRFLICIHIRNNRWCSHRHPHLLLQFSMSCKSSHLPGIKHAAIDEELRSIMVGPPEPTKLRQQD